MRKSNEEREHEQILKAMAANTAMWHKQAQAGTEMEKWVADGHYQFIQERILAPIEMEWFRKVKGIKLGPTGLQNVARIQGAMEIFDVINARINHLVQLGKDAIDHLKDLQHSTQEGE